MGQILANFHLGIFERDPRTRKIKNYKDPRITAIEDMFKRTIVPRYRVDIDVAIFGLRNLIRKAVKPRMTIRLTNDHSEPNQGHHFVVEPKVDDES